MQGVRCGPGHRGDARYRSGRRGHRAVRGLLAVRDDAGVRRRVAAREDRHARLRGRRGDQQVRAPRCRGRAPGRGAAAGAQPRGVRCEVGGHAGLRHVGRHVQRRRCDRAVPVPPRRAHRARPSDRRRLARHHQRQDVDQRLHDRAGGPRPLPVRHRGHRARLSPQDRRAGRRGPHAPPAHRRAEGTRNRGQGRAGHRRARRRRRSARSTATSPTCCGSGRRRASSTPATSSCSRCGTRRSTPS